MPWKSESSSQQRWNFIREVLRHKKPVAELCRRHRISRKTGYKWIRRFKERGRFGLADRDRAPERVHNRPECKWLKRIRRWRQKHPSWGARKLRWVLQRKFGRKKVPSAAAVGRWLKQWGVTRQRRRRIHHGPTIQRSKLTMAEAANDVWTIDFKGWFRTADGRKVEPLTVRDLASRYVLGIVFLKTQRMKECRLALEKMFHEYGLPAVIRTDNGSPFGAIGALGLTQLSAWWVKLGIKVEFIEPGRPDQNGAHEQFHRVYKEETLQPPAPTIRAQKGRSERWRKEYNHHRPHEALKMKVPAAVYRKSRRKMPPTLKPFRYPVGYFHRLVRGKGQISWRGRTRFVGEAFERERVGLRRKQNDIWEVYYGTLLMGELWDRDAVGIRAVWFSRGKKRK